MKYLETNYFKLRNKLWNYAEVVSLTEKILEMEKKEWKKEVQIGIAYNVACVLNALPFGFGKKRLTKFFELLFAQSIWINEQPDDASLVISTVNNTGIKFAYKNEYLQLLDDDKTKANFDKKCKVDNLHSRKNKGA